MPLDLHRLAAIVARLRGIIRSAGAEGAWLQADVSAMEHEIARMADQQQVEILERGPAPQRCDWCGAEKVVRNERGWKITGRTCSPACAANLREIRKAAKQWDTAEERGETRMAR